MYAVFTEDHNSLISPNLNSMSITDLGHFVMFGIVLSVTRHPSVHRDRVLDVPSHQTKVNTLSASPSTVN